MAKQNGNHSTNSLRQSLFEELDLLRDGQISTKRARAFAAITREILSSARIELDAKRLALEYELGDSSNAKPNLSLVA